MNPDAGDVAVDATRDMPKARVAIEQIVERRAEVAAGAIISSI